MGHYTLMKMNKLHLHVITWINLHPEEKKPQKKNPFWIIQLIWSFFKNRKNEITQFRDTYKGVKLVVSVSGGVSCFGRGTRAASGVLAMFYFLGWEGFHEYPLYNILLREYIHIFTYFPTVSISQFKVFFKIEICRLILGTTAVI